ncbi:MAG: polysaccharide lyase [Pseudomonadota bacterium]
MQDYQTSDGTVTSGAIRRGFDNHDNGQEYEISLQERDWDVRFGETTAENATISNEYAVSGGQSLRVTYQDDENDAAASSWALPEEDTYYLSYWVLFEDGFDFNGDDHSGGKLPGLASDGLASGGGDVTGENGFTARYMWREDGAAELYLYHMDKPGRYGESFEFVDADDEPIKFQPGEWHQLIQKVTINDGRQANGEITVWMDGQEVLDLDGLRFVTDGSGIDRLYFSSFFGGNDDGWLPERDVNAYFDEFVISTDPTDVGLREDASASPQTVFDPPETQVAGREEAAELPGAPVPEASENAGAAPDIAMDVAKAWQGGFKGTLSITNDSDEIIDDWTLLLEMDGFDIIKLWRGDMQRVDDMAVISGSGRSEDIGVGETVEIGFIADGMLSMPVWNFDFG